MQKETKIIMWTFICSLFVILAVIGGIMFSVTDYISNQFTYTNMEVKDGYIQNKLSEVLYPIPLKNGYSLAAYDDTYGVNGLIFCQELGYTFLSQNKVYHNSYVLYTYYYNNKWNYMTSNARADRIVDLVCQTDDYQTAGNVEQTIATTSTEKYNYFKVEYNEILNGGTIEPYLIMGEQKVYFDDDNTINQHVVSDTMIKLGFDSEGSTLATPQIAKDSIKLIKEYKDTVTGETQAYEEVFFSASERTFTSDGYGATLGNNVVWFFTQFGWFIGIIFVLTLILAVIYKIKRK